MKVLRLLLIPVFACICVAQAPDAKKAKVEELFRLTQLDQILGQSLANARNQIQSGAMQQLAGGELTAKQRELLTDFQNKMMDLLTQTLAWNKLEPDMAKLYMDAFTSEELDSAIAFYRSPAGQAMVQKTPQLMTQASTITQQHLQGMQGDLKKMMDDLREKLAAAAGGPPDHSDGK